MAFQYNEGEKELFDQLNQRVKSLLRNHINNDLEITILEKFRKFNFSIEVSSEEGTENFHVKSFYYAVEGGEYKKYDWAGPVIARTKTIYEMIDEYNLNLHIPDLVLIDYEMEIIITRLYNGIGLDKLLLGDDSIKAIEGLKLMSITLASLHSQTYQLQHQFSEKLKTNMIEPNIPLEWVRWSNQSIQDLLEGLLQVEQNSQPEHNINQFIQDLHKVKKLVEKSRFISLINSDPCPDNLLIEDDQMMMIDLDTFTFYFSFIDVYYLWARISCWCVGTFDESITNELEQLYLDEYRKSVNILDQEFHFNVILGAIMWMSVEIPRLFRTYNDVLSIDHPDNWGTANMVSRLFSRVDQLKLMFQSKQKHIPDDHVPLIERILQFIVQVSIDMNSRFELQYLQTYPAFKP